MRDVDESGTVLMSGWHVARPCTTRRCRDNLFSEETSMPLQGICPMKKQGSPW